MPGWGWANLPPLIPSHSEAVGGESATTPFSKAGHDSVWRPWLERSGFVLRTGRHTALKSATQPAGNAGNAEGCQHSRRHR